MAELRKSTEVVKILDRSIRSGTPGWVDYSPGDGTKYRVHLIRAVPVNAAGPLTTAQFERQVYRALLIQAEVGSPHTRSMLVSEPAPTAKFTPHMWLDLGFTAGCWPAVRPLLAALAWTSLAYESLKFDPRDEVEITGIWLARRTGMLPRVGAGRGR